MKYKYINFLLIFFSLISFTSEVMADNRRYVWTYEYMTTPRGKAEFEHYFTLSAPKINEMKGNTISTLQFEFEIGMTDNFDIGIYQVFSQAPSSSFAYDGYKIRARYKFGEKNLYIVDPLLYIEYVGTPDFTKHEIETKLILAKDFDKFNISFNPILAFEKEDKKWETKPEYALGVSYELAELIRFGFEFKGSEEANYLGPVISHGKDGLWMSLGSAFKIGKVEKGKPEFELRWMLGIGL